MSLRFRNHWPHVRIIFSWFYIEFSLETVLKITSNFLYFCEKQNRKIKTAQQLFHQCELPQTKNWYQNVENLPGKLFEKFIWVNIIHRYLIMICVHNILYDFVWRKMKNSEKISKFFWKLKFSKFCFLAFPYSI